MKLAPVLIDVGDCAAKSAATQSRLLITAVGCRNKTYQIPYRAVLLHGVAQWTLMIDSVVIASPLTRSRNDVGFVQFNDNAHHCTLSNAYL